MDDLLARLERERLEADRLYHDALTALDRSIQKVPDLPPSLQRLDQQLPRLDQRWNILPGGPPTVDGSLKGRLRGFIWRLVGPPLEAQRRFNADLVEHVNRSVAAQQQAQETIGRLLDAVAREFAALVRFESQLLHYLRTITLYVDTKDRSAGGADLRERLVLAEQRWLGLKREVETLSGRRREVEPPADGTFSSSTRQAFSGNLDSATYLGFEDRFRGSQEEIRSRLTDYVSLFSSASDVVDIGCGRGEFLELLRTHGVTARGVDANDAMVHECRARGLDVTHGDALGFLEQQQDGCLGGLVAIQVVEHFEPAYLLRVLEASHHKMRVGAPLVLETINPACWMAFFDCYLRDVTHRQALHPDTLRYLVQSSGFSNVDVRYRSPILEQDRLERVANPALPDGGDPRLFELASAINAHADKLNARLFSSMDYAIVARR